jgi:hypothetical protein
LRTAPEVALEVERARGRPAPFFRPVQPTLEGVYLPFMVEAKLSADVLPRLAATERPAGEVVVLAHNQKRNSLMLTSGVHQIAWR